MFCGGVIVVDDKRQSTIRFEPELLCKIAFVAKENKRSLNAQLEYLAQKCVDLYEKENGEIIVSESELYSK